MAGFIERLPNWLRWVMAFPSAFIGGWLIKILAVLCYQLYNGVDPSGGDFWSLFLGTASEVMAFMAIIYYIIPSHKFITTTIVAALWGGFTLFILANSMYNYWGYGELWKSVVIDLTIIIILIYFIVTSYKQEHPQVDIFDETTTRYYE